MKRLVDIGARIVDPRTLPIAVTILLFCALFGFGSVMYTGFFSLQVLLDLLIDNAFLLIVAIGMTAYRLPVGTGSVSANVLIALAALAAAIFVAHFTRFGRNVYAVGGNPRSALLMGLPVAQTRIGVYALSGFCSALGGAVFTFYVLSGYGLQGQGMELDAIAATVIGGTLLTGGVGYVIGSLFGVGILGTIQTLITFDGTLSSWWTRIVIGALLCAFCLLQRLIERHARSVRRPGGPSGAVATPSGERGSHRGSHDSAASDSQVTGRVPQGALGKAPGP